MELKYIVMSCILFDLQSSNRTFMELKFNNVAVGQERGFVLIVPLWN